MAEKSIYQAVGKRKNAIARVYLKPGKGELVVNGRSFEEYFGRESSRMIVKQPLELTKLTNQFHISINSSGGGLSGQAEAIRHGLSKAILQFNPELRKELKKAGYLTRDSRVVERKKYGRHKARKRPQYSKR
ncbi:MAG: 30S ribosomal protein S9 [Deltaproteobacteria bacterium RIFCSPHIGHO2_12_FULL_43_9]|nr:MAG: 30S ribosomal protein S9 [Deltaproteobacteria bacterium RIFCSPHIGHO2_12_FULL_43_9]